MKKDQLFHLFASLSKPEISRFKQFVSHPFYNSKQNVINLVDFLAKNVSKYPEGSFGELKQKAFNKIFGKIKYNSLKMSRLSVLTLTLLNDFLMQEELKLEKKHREEVLKKAYRRRHLGDFYAAALKQGEKDLKKHPERDFYYHREMVGIQHETYFNIGNNKFASKDLLGDLVVIHKGLDAGYLLAKLHYACQMKVIQRLRGQSKEVPFLDKVLEMSEDAAFENNQLVQFYLQLLALLEEPTSEGFEELKGEMTSCFLLVNKELKLHLFVLLINLSWLAIERRQWSVVAFELYEYAVGAGILIENGQMSASHFNNIVDIGCSLGKFDFIREFIKSSLPYLELGDDFEVNVRTLYESFLYFGEGQYAKVLQHLNYLEFEDYSYGVRAYLLLIKSLYETKKSKGYEELDARCEAFTQYVRRKHQQGFIGEMVRTENLNFIKIIRQLPFASTSKYAKIPANGLKEELSQMDRVVSRGWLKKKIDEL